MHHLHNYLQNMTSYLLVLKWESNQHVSSQVMCRTNVCIPNDVKLFLAQTGNYHTSLRVMNTEDMKKIRFSILGFFFNEN